MARKPAKKATTAKRAARKAAKQSGASTAATAPAGPSLDDLRQADKKLAEQRKRLRAAIKGMPQREADPEVERRRDAERKRKSRLQARRVQVTVTSASLRRRSRMEKDVQRWLRFYFPEVFEHAFTENQTAIVNAILTAANVGGDQSIAAPRGDGKTSIAECVIVYCVLTGVLSFPVIFSATGDDAERILSNIKQRLEENERLVEDYGEVCQPAAALEGQSNRASGQVVYGSIGTAEFTDQRSKIRWSGRQIVLPTIKCKGSRASGQVIATRGLDAAVRGLRYGVMRPDLAVIDDPETRDIAGSTDDRQRQKLELKIDQDIAGCAGQTRRLSRVILTTIMSRRSLSYKYTDPAQKPSFRGRRFRYMVKPPERQDLWDEFVMLRHADWAADPPTQRAHEFYMANRKPMDAGAVVGNPHRRGDAIEASAIETYYVEVARIGQESVSTEFDNDPPEETGPIESGITAYRVQRQLSGYPRRIVPPGCTVITQGIDVRKIALHFVARAWRPDGTGYTIDYGVQEVLGTIRGSDDGLEMAITQAIRARMEFLATNPYRTPDGQEVPVDLTLVDAGWQTQVIYHACRQLGRDIQPAMGFGQSAGCVQARFSEVIRPSPDRKPGDGWFLSRQRRGTWLVCMDADRWKTWEHARWMTATDKPGTMFLYGEPSDTQALSFDEKGHFSYAKHVTAEIEIEEVVKGRLVRRWTNKSDTNHYLDASYMANVAANMKGVRLLREPAGRHQPEVKGGWFAAQERKTKRRANPTD
jgi:hypothetical protein